MKNLTEKKEELDFALLVDQFQYKGYKEAIEGILKDIQNSNTLSVDSIELYLQDLLK